MQNALPTKGSRIATVAATSRASDARVDNREPALPERDAELMSAALRTWELLGDHQNHTLTYVGETPTRVSGASLDATNHVSDDRRSRRGSLEIRSLRLGENYRGPRFPSIGESRSDRGG